MYKISSFVKGGYSKILLSVLFIWYFLNSALNTDKWHFIDNVNLIIHEAGHWIFIFFGQFMSVIGGSLTQFLIPFIFVIYFFIKKDLYSASLISIWVGYNIVNISVYMSDSIYMKLPLLGGESSIHDWNYIFNTFNVLDQSLLISSIINALGMFVIIGGSVFSIKFIFSNSNNY